MELNIISVFLVGLLGGTHCVGMCGGIVGALSLQLPNQAPQWRFHLAYSTGRIASYVLVGAIAGAAGASSLLLANILPVKQALYLLANLLLVALGLYLAGLSSLVLRLEGIGAGVWQRLATLLSQVAAGHRACRKRWRSARVWGWVPCGLVYSMLISALASGSAVGGGTLMLAFGLGTLPNLLAMGYFARQLKDFMQNRSVRLAAGLLVGGFGVLGLYRQFIG